MFKCKKVAGQSSAIPVTSEHKTPHFQPIPTLPTTSKEQQDCIPVGCIPPTCCPYLPACTAPGEVPAWGRGVPVRGSTCLGEYLLGVIPAWGCTCLVRVHTQGGVPARVGEYLPRGCTCLGEEYLPGVPAWGGVPAQGEYLIRRCVPARRGVPTQVLPPCPREHNSWHTLLKILSCPNFIAGGKNSVGI